jgi:hypothetical protein
VVSDKQDQQHSWQQQQQGCCSWTGTVSAARAAQQYRVQTPTR